MHATPVALVTGASRGIGRALACGLARDGFRVAALARTVESISGLQNEAGVDRAHMLLVPFDLSNTDSIVKAIATVRREFGQIDLLVNNAAMAAVGTLEVPLDNFEALLKVNLTGPFKVLQEVIPLMLAQKHGMVINVASRAGKIGFADCGAYGASKFGLVGLGESLYRELAPKGIKLTTLCPSWVDTQMAQEAGTPLSASEMIQPEDLMKTVRWLLSLSPAACVREIMIECRAAIE